jgi:hypothetical protein
MPQRLTYGPDCSRPGRTAPARLALWRVLGLSACRTVIAKMYTVMSCDLERRRGPPALESRHAIVQLWHIDAFQSVSRICGVVELVLGNGRTHRSPRLNHLPVPKSVRRLASQPRNDPGAMPWPRRVGMFVVRMIFNVPLNNALAHRRPGRWRVNPPFPHHVQQATDLGAIVV